MNRGSDPIVWPLADDLHWLRAFVRQLVTTSDVDDVLQSTWLAAVQRRNHARPLLATIARRAAALLHRSRRRRDERERAVATQNPTAPSTLALVERMEEVRRVATAVCELAEPYRGTLLRHHENGESIAAIAIADGTSEAAVRKRLQRARELVLARLARRERPARGAWMLLPRMPGTQRRAAWAVAASALTFVAAGTALSRAAADTPPAQTRTPSARTHGHDAPPTAPPGTERTAVLAGGDAVAQEPAATEPARALPQLVVHVRHADGRPAARAIVRLGAEDRWADAEGTARLPLDRDPAERPDRISARLLPPSGSGPNAPILVVVRDGMRSLAVATDTVDLELRFGAPLATIRGRVVDAAEEPVSRATVFLAEAEPLDPDPSSSSVLQPLEDLATTMEGEAVLGEGVCNSAHFAQTDANGEFVLTGLWPHPYVLRAVEWKSHRTVVSAPVLPGADDVVMRLPDARPRRLRGRATRPLGAPAGDVQVAALMPLQRIGEVQEYTVVATTRTDRDGSFDFSPPSTALAIGVRENGWLRTTIDVPTTDAPLTLLADVPHGLSFADHPRWPTAVAIEITDAAERPLPAFVDREPAPQRTRHRWTGDAAFVLFTRADAAVARLLAADGSTLRLLPLAPMARETVVVR